MLLPPHGHASWSGSTKRFRAISLGARVRTQRFGRYPCVVPTVAIVQEYIPTYRLSFFTHLVEEMRSRQIDLQIFAGVPQGEQSLRADAVSSSHVQPLRQNEIRVLGRRLVISRLHHLAASADLLILEQARRNVAAYPLLFGRPSARIALWGHGRDYAVKTTSFEKKLNATLTRRADWFFGYTAGSARAVADIGFPSDRVTVVQNSTDTAELREHLRTVTSDQLRSFGERNDLRGCTAVFMGGLDRSKRLPFLLDSARLIHEELSDFRILIVGQGAEAAYVRERARKEPWIKYLGPLEGHDKAIALSSAEISMVPGRVGLFAVDSLCAGLPLFTTTYEFHAPEFEYLVPGETTSVTDGSEPAFAGDIVALLSDTAKLSAMQAKCVEHSDRFSIGNMASNFATGITLALGREKRT
jgi:glycosyltransferase involved in cell wall biosynthesis